MFKSLRNQNRCVWHGGGKGTIAWWLYNCFDMDEKKWVVMKVWLSVLWLWVKEKT
jgi:hypothetical protein